MVAVTENMVVRLLGYVLRRLFGVNWVGTAG